MRWNSLLGPKKDRPSCGKCQHRAKYRCESQFEGVAAEQIHTQRLVGVPLCESHAREAVRIEAQALFGLAASLQRVEQKALSDYLASELTIDAFVACLEEGQFAIQSEVLKMWSRFAFGRAREVTIACFVLRDKKDKFPKVAPGLKKCLLNPDPIVASDALKLIGKMYGSSEREVRELIHACLKDSRENVKKIAQSLSLIPPQSSHSSRDGMRRPASPESNVWPVDTESSGDWWRERGE